ncbi:YeiH family protein [Sulfurospirillum sp. 1307]|jgi:uncharacterized integral membrane protein (TIGR00698 family)
MIQGLILVSLFALVATFLSNFIGGLSPLIIGIVLGMIYANTLRHKLPKSFESGIIFSTKTILRGAIIFYGFRLTFQDIFQVGLSGILVSTLIVTLTFIIGYFVGTKILKMDRDTAILTTAGSSICGAAAILATEPVVKGEAYKTAIAVSTVVLFGTISMFLYPFLYKSGLIPLSPQGMGIYIGGTLHEVAHVVGAGSAISQEVANSAVIVKMIRVMLLAPFLILLSLWLSKTATSKEKQKITIPWFAIWFIVVAGFNSFEFIPNNIIQNINIVDTFALTMAMSALGMQTNFKKFKQAGLKPIYLASILFLWLVFGGFYITDLTMNF